MKYWQSSEYQKIKNAKFVNENLEVSFENGDTVRIHKNSFVPLNIKSVEWDNLHFNSFEIIIPASPKSLEIPWDKIRVITDKEFSNHLKERSIEQSKLIGTKIKQLRVMKGIKSKDLAERIGIPLKTLSRIEIGQIEVNFSILRRILATIGYSLKDLANQETENKNEITEKSLNILIKQLSYVGIDSNFLKQKIIPIKLQEALGKYKSNQPQILLDEVASYISTIYGWSLDELWDQKNLIFKDPSSKMAIFKKPSNSNINQVIAYSHYAYYLAKIVIKLFSKNTKNVYPQSLEEFKTQYFNKYDSINLESLLNFTWELGICVLPLNDPGVFHGASWNISSKHVIILKNNTQFHSRWIFDLLHELYHVFSHLNKNNTSVIEIDEMNPFANDESIEESEANTFANQFIFENRAEKLAEQCVVSAKRKIENLKRAVESISKKEKIRVDFLSNYLAYRLSYQGENWWGAASKMQIIEPTPFGIASRILQKNINMQKLNKIDFNLLNTAIMI